MPTSKTRRKKSPKRVLTLPDLEHAKTAVLNSLTSASGQRTYDHAIREFVAWYCSEPRQLRLADSSPSIGVTLDKEGPRRIGLIEHRPNAEYSTERANTNPL
jgi:hypothetical protein